MGGGASSLTTSMEELLATTYMIGRAIAAISCPGMYRIYDFQSPKAPKLKNAAQNFLAFNPFVQESDDETDEGEREANKQPNPDDYIGLFSVIVGEDTIYIEDPLCPNEAGWTPLHTCCMSYMTVAAGAKLIEETVRRGGDLDCKTLSGPGSFNKGWTALHMACAYGVEPLAEKLITEGADVNCQNCFGYTPLLEACHRGFVNIVSYLVKSPQKVSLAYIPSEEDSMASPFVSSPAQSALGEAARSGYPRIVQILLDSGAPHNQQNGIGWTALHEACFFNRAEVVKALLLAGADASIRTHSGALPYHLAGLQMIRTMLEDMGGSDAVPRDGDSIDMVAILNELTIAETTIVAGADGSFEVIRRNDNRPAQQRSIEPQPDRKPAQRPQQLRIAELGAKHDRQEKEVIEAEHPDLHNGPALGVLPALAKSSPTKTPVKGSQEAASGSGSGSGSVKAKKKRSKHSSTDGDTPADIPKEFLCQLTKKPMSDPVRSTYGHVFDRASLDKWFNTQGKICPFTGNPLCDVDLTPLPDLAVEIHDWLLQRAKGRSEIASIAYEKKEAEVLGGQQQDQIRDAKMDDDLYEF